MMQIRRGDDHDLAEVAGVDLEQTPGGHVETNDEFEDEQTKLLRASKISKWTTVGLTLAFLVLWPFPMYGSSYVFSKPFFTGWVTVGIIWIFGSLGAVGLFPIFEGRHTLKHTFKSIFLDLSGRKHPKTIHAQRLAADEKRTSDLDTPSKKDSATVDEEKF
jgi:hypothetical protein